MPENASVFRATQLGVEVTKGVLVPANRRLLSTGFTITPVIPVDPFRAAGSKANTTATGQKEHTEGDIEGRLSFRDMVYLLSGVTEAATIATPSGATNTRRWTFNSNNFAVDDYVTYTVETGPQASAFGERATYGLISSLGISLGRDKADVSGSVMAQKLTDGITVTASPTDINPAPVSPNLVDVFLGSSLVNEVQTVTLGGPSAGTFLLTLTNPFTGVTAQTAAIAFNAASSAVQSALEALSIVQVGDVTVSGAAGGPYTVTFTGRFAGINVAVLVGDFTGLTGGAPVIATTTPGGMTKLARCLEFDWNVDGRFSPIFTLCASDPSFSAEVERPMDLTARILLEHDSASTGFVANLRNLDTLYCRMVANGTLIEADFPFRIDLLFAFKFGETTRSDQDDIWAAEYNLIPLYDSTIGGWSRWIIDTDLTAL